MNKRLTTNKIWHALAKRLGKTVANGDIKFEADILCPAEASDVFPATYINEHLSRITGSNEHTSQASEHACLLRRNVEHAPTILFRMEDARLFGAGIFSKSRNYLPRSIIKNRQLAPISLPKALLIDNDITQVYFGHWLTDQLSSALIATPEMPALALNTPSFTHAQGYEQLFQISTCYAQQGQVDELYWLSDFSQNSYKVKRYQQLRQRAEQNLSPANCSATGIYIARGNSGAKRALLNEQELINHLLDRGFEIIYPEKMTPEMITRCLWNAPVVISVEGSQIAHTIHSISRNASVLILMPPNRVSHIFKGIFDAIDKIAYGFYVCAAAQNSNEFYVDSFVDLDRLVHQLKENTGSRS